MKSVDLHVLLFKMRFRRRVDTVKVKCIFSGFNNTMLRFREF